MPNLKGFWCVPQLAYHSIPKLYSYGLWVSMGNPRGFLLLFLQSVYCLPTVWGPYIGIFGQGNSRGMPRYAQFPVDNRMAIWLYDLITEITRLSASFGFSRAIAFGCFKGPMVFQNYPNTLGLEIFGPPKGRASGGVWGSRGRYSQGVWKTRGVGELEYGTQTLNVWYIYLHFLQNYPVF